jgi:hypothetical protein
MILLSSRSQNTELATAAQRNQSAVVKLTVEKAFCRKPRHLMGMELRF